jgi:putative Ca2+/H+ antiporter (TMEM165/GDT1 family)
MMTPDLVSVSMSSFVLIALAEMGDKSQLVCMTLAARHRHWPVLLGAALAFLLLNLLAVIFGAALADWLPQNLVMVLVALLFAGFGIHSLLASDDEQDAEVDEKPGHGIFLTTLLLIFVAEFGDKTQLAVAALAGRLDPVAVWVGASAALIAVSALGVWVGRTLLKTLPVVWLHRFSGVLFLGFALLAIWPLL